MRIRYVAGIALAAIVLVAAQASRQSANQRIARAQAITSEQPRSATESRVVDGNVVAYTTANADLAAARAKARDTLPRFATLMASGMKATFTVKFPLTQNARTEHIWLQVSAIRDDAYVGRLANNPVNGTAYKMGDSLTVPRNKVEDWMVRTPDAIYGGYTARYAMKDMPPQQAEKIAALFRD